MKTGNHYRYSDYVRLSRRCNYLRTSGNSEMLEERVGKTRMRKRNLLFSLEEADYRDVKEGVILRQILRN